jgi:hypothetical protein
VRNFKIILLLAIVALLLFIDMFNKSYTQEGIVLPYEAGVLIVLETRYLGNRGDLMAEMTIMKKGNRIRIEETFPLPLNKLPNDYKEAKIVTISDGEVTWRLSPFGKEKLNPITDLLKYLGIKYSSKLEKKSGMLDREGVRVIKNSQERYYVDEKSHCILRKEHGIETTFYKDYAFVEGIGYLPRKIERYSKNKIEFITEVKQIGKSQQFSDSLFDLQQVEFSTAGKEIIKRFSD